MPELPEVETITRRLRPYLLGKKITGIENFHRKSFSGKIVDILNQEIESVERRGKTIRIHFANGLNSLIHLKMTGQLIYVDKQHRVGGGHPTEDWIQDLPSTHTRTQFFFNDDSKLFFNDQRLFGWIKVMSDEEVENEWRKLGPDVNSTDFTLEYFAKKLKNKSVPIKVAIMDNAIVSGIGNIYACDTLNLAQISPFKPAKELSTAEVAKLFKSARLIIDKGIFLGGATTDGKYIDVHGFAGKYQLEARTYHREGEPCLHCGEKIKKVKLAGRGTYYCPSCQR